MWHLGKKVTTRYCASEKKVALDRFLDYFRWRVSAFAEGNSLIFPG